MSIAEKTTEFSVTGLPDYTATLVKVQDVNGSKIWARDILKYSVIVKNSGKKAGGSIVLNCPVPTGTGYVDGTASGSGLTISPNKSLIQFNIDKIEPGAQKEFSFKVFVAEYLTFSSDIKSDFFITDSQEKISLENPLVKTEPYMFQTVVCMGDSQVVLSDYTAQLGMLLNSQYTHAIFNVIPTGVKGEMANFAIQRFDEDVRIHNPDIIVIGYGCNDAGEATGLYRYHMEILISQAVSTGAKVFVYGVGYIDLSISKWLGKANYTTFNEILKNDVCPKYGAVYVDLYGPMSKDYKKYIKEDGMHWTEEGATLAAGEVFKAITTVLDSEGRITVK
jgi:lysophospholipase L1-like esterase